MFGAQSIRSVTSTEVNCFNYDSKYIVTPVTIVTFHMKDEFCEDIRYVESDCFNFL